MLRPGSISVAWGVAVVLLLASAPRSEAASGTVISVSYRSADSVYLDAGKAVGLAEGERVEVVRTDRVVGILEVVYVAEHSSSARVLEATEEIRPGDRVRRLPGASPAPAPVEPTAVSPEREESTVSAPRPFRPEGRVGTDLFGTVTLDWEGFSDSGDTGRDWQRTSLGLRLGGRDLGGLPLGVRVRLRATEIDRDRVLLSGVVPESESRDRLYELSLSWEPPAGRWALRAGRLGASPAAGIGYLDGALAEVRVGGPAFVGAFAGRRPDVTELGLDGEGTKAGAFVRFAPQPDLDDPTRWRLVVAGLREETDAGASRDIVSVEGNWDGERWSVSEYLRWQLAGELVGLGESLREEEAGLLELALLARLRLDRGRGLSISYDRLEPRPELDQPAIGPEALFVERLRQGLAIDWDGGDGVGWRWHAGVGLRRGEVSDEEAEDAISIRFGGRTSRLLPGLSLGLNVIGFSAPETDGLLVNLRGGHRFEPGHELEVALGATGMRDVFEQDRITGWARLSGWAELPGRLYARAEAEIAAGDDYEGLRLGLGLGYRL